ncbi:MAG: HAD family hydrolase [Pseudomonadota bacterium]
MILKALIFDVDGTLADTEKDGHRVAFNLAFKDADLNWDWDDKLYGQLLAVTGGKERIRYYLEQFNTRFVKPDNFTDFVAQLHASKTKFYMQLMEQGRVPLRTGVEQLINQARDKGLRLAIATTTTPANVTALLHNTLGKGSEQWFEVIAAGDIVPAKKPAADIFVYALQQLNLSAQECLAFEDSENGLKSAKGAGLKTVITTNDYTREQDFSNADLILDQFGDTNSPFKVIDNKGLQLNDYSFFNIELAQTIIED